MAQENRGIEKAPDNNAVVQEATWVPGVGWILRIKPKDGPPLTIKLPAP